jgi:hypothetical protein
MALDPKQLLRDGLNAFVEQAKGAAQQFGKQSEAIGDAALETGRVTLNAAEDLAAGQLDLEGARRIARRSAEQMVSYAAAEGNLAAAIAGNMFMSWGQHLLNIISVVGLQF